MLIWGLLLIASPALVWVVLTVALVIQHLWALLSHSERKVVNTSFTVLDLVGVLFVGLKLVGVIAWSWWWVTLPFWGPVAVLLAVIAVLAVVTFVLMLTGKGKAS